MLLETHVLLDPRLEIVCRVGAQVSANAGVSAVAHEPPNGAAGHNSIEQDVDMVQLPHREDAYERESPRAGEADFILAKHRNRPTANITVAFQGHYSRVVGKAQS